jgi:membrane protease YdiL (CAAX protease family)
MLSGLLLIGLVCYLMHVDASILQAHDPGAYGRAISRRPLFWSVGSLFLFAILGALYLYRRRRYFQSAPALPSPVHLPFPVTLASGTVIAWSLFLTLLMFGWQLKSASSDGGFDLAAGMAQNLIGCALFFLLIFIQTKRSQYSFGELIYARGSDDKNAVPLYVPVVLALGLAAAVSYLLLARDSTPSTPLSGALREAGRAQLLFFGMTAVLSAPLFEEILFRGYIFDILDRTKGRRARCCSASCTRANISATGWRSAWCWRWASC